MNTLTRRNFLIAGAIGAAGALGLTGCGGTADQGSSPAEAAQEPEEQAARYAVGDTVETDLVRLTLNRAELAIALVNTLEIGTGFNIDNDYFCPKEYTAEEDADNPYVASKGSTLVFYELLVENLDRDYLELDGSSQDEPFVSVSYDGETYSTEDFEEKKYGWMVRDIEGSRIGAATRSPTSWRASLRRTCSGPMSRPPSSRIRSATRSRSPSRSPRSTAIPNPSRSRSTSEQARRHRSANPAGGTSIRRHPLLIGASSE